LSFQKNIGNFGLALSSGWTVSNIRESDIREFCEIRGVLEGYAARCAAALVTPDEIARLEKYNRKFVQLAISRQTSGMDMVRTHNDFHEFILKLCGNHKMLEIYSGLGQKFIRFRFMAAAMVQVDDIKQDHGKIIEALRAGDGPRAEEAVRKNADRGLAALLNALATTHKNLGSAA
jgi:DNA-binding GntR family transcriptional regulator